MRDPTRFLTAISIATHDAKTKKDIPTSKKVRGHRAKMKRDEATFGREEVLS